MRILYINYWEFDDPLTQSAAIPYVKIISEFVFVEEIIMVTLERTNTGVSNSNYFRHIPIKTSLTKASVINQGLSFITLPNRIIRAVKQYKINKVLARGAMAGGLAYLVSGRLKVHFLVESFEPHAKYMVESGVWKKAGVKNILQSYLERKQKINAKKLITVSHNFARHLIDQQIEPERISTIPCCVDLTKFNFNEFERISIREQLYINEDHVVGIYVGKFGGLYYNEEAFQIFKEAFRLIKSFRLIIVSRQDMGFIKNSLRKSNIDMDKVFLISVEHNEVNKYLSAADFAFCTVKPSPSKKFCSPVKNAEYMASGLPILISCNIGDDSELINEEKLGAVFKDFDSSLHTAYGKIKETLLEKEHRMRIRTFAEKYKSYDIAEKVYRQIFNNFN